MTWAIVAILSYFILAIVFLIDKHLLTKVIPNPKVYAFYVGTLGISVLILAPFIGFYVPEFSQVILSLLVGALFIYGLFWFYKTLQLFEPSRVIPAIGGLTPLFSFILIYIFTLGEEVLYFKELIAFILLVFGAVLISIKKEKLIDLKSLKFSAITAFFLSLPFVLMKYVFLAQPFWNGFIWRSIGGFLMAICIFVLFSEVRKEVLKKFTSQPLNHSEKNKINTEKEKLPKKTIILFLSNQVAGAGAAILQNWAIALAPLIYIPFISALQGTQYIFLFILTIFLSLTWPFWSEKIGLKEEISRKIILQKIIAIILISGGLVLFFI